MKSTTVAEVLAGLVVTVVVAGLATAANAQSDTTRIDLYDSQSRRSGYITIDPRSGRLDQFDKNSNRLGYGTVTTPSSGGTRVDTYSNNGTRAGSGTLPITPRR
jgi:hypothetical protein